jgi:uncharacterized membrane protein
MESITVWHIIRPNFNIGWNLVLAFLPLCLSFLLFRTQQTNRSIFWWLGLVVFVAFLPNAPYVLTDIVHLVAKVRVQPPLPIWAKVLLVIEFGLYFLLGFQAYVVSLINLDSYLRRHGSKKWIVPVELTATALSSLGIYLGRFQRSNSWDIVTAPEKLVRQTAEDLMTRFPLKVILLTFAVITILYYSFKFLNITLLRLFSWHPGD